MSVFMCATFSSRSGVAPGICVTIQRTFNSLSSFVDGGSSFVDGGSSFVDDGSSFVDGGFEYSSKNMSCVTISRSSSMCTPCQPNSLTRTTYTWRAGIMPSWRRHSQCEDSSAFTLVEYYVSFLYVRPSDAPASCIQIP